MRNIIPMLGQENGSVMVVTLLILVLLTIIGISASNTSITEVQISTNEQLSRIVFYGAESGLGVGRQFLNDLKTANPGHWDNLLAGNTFTWLDADGNEVDISTLDEAVDATWNRNAGLATYTLQVSDNDDLDGNLAVDTDNVIILTSTATYRNARARVQAMVRYRGPSDDYAQEHYNTGNTSGAVDENAEIAGSRRW
jgi:Tfp pilus assembly protein PilX